MDGNTIEDVLKELPHRKPTALSVYREMSKDNEAIAKVVIQNEPEIRKLEPIGTKVHNLEDVESLKRYIQKFRTENTVVYCSREDAFVTVILDEKHEAINDQLRFSPKYTPGFKETMASSDRVPDFLAWFRCNKRYIVSPDPKEFIALTSLVKIETVMETIIGTGKNAKSGYMCESKVRGSEENVPIEFPETIIFRSPVFFGTPEIEIEIELDVVMNEDEHLRINRRCYERKEATIEAFGLIAQDLEEKVGSMATVVSGNPQYCSHHYQ